MSRQSHRPCPPPPPPPPPPFSSAYRSNLACGYLHLQHRPPHLIFFVSTSFSGELVHPIAESCQRLKFFATKVQPTHRILPPPSKAPAHRRATHSSPRLQYGAAGLPVPPRLTPPSAAARLHPRLQGSDHLLQPPPTRQSSHTLHQQKIGPWQDSVKFSPASLSRDVQASQISSPSKILSSPRNFQIPPLHSNQRPQRARAANHPTRGPAQSSLPQGPASGHRTAAAGPRPAWAAPRMPQPSAPTFLELSPSASSQLSPAKSQPSPPQAASPEQARLRQRQTAIRSLGSTNPSPTHGPQLRHLRLALLHQRKPRLPLSPPLSPFTKPFQAQTYPNH